MSGFKQGFYQKRKKKEVVDFKEISVSSLKVIAEWLSRAYEGNHQVWESQCDVSYIGRWHRKSTGLDVTAVSHKNDIVLLMPGTKQLEHILSDIMLFANKGTLTSRFDLNNFFNELFTTIAEQNPNYENIICIGHSLGTHLAELFTAYLISLGLGNNVKCISIESTGNKNDIVGKFLSHDDHEKYPEKCFKIFNSPPNGLNSSRPHIVEPNIVTKLQEVEEETHSNKSRTKKYLSLLRESHGIDGFSGPKVDRIISPEDPKYSWDQTYKMQEFLSSLTHDAHSLGKYTISSCSKYCFEYCIGLLGFMNQIID